MPILQCLHKSRGQEPRIHGGVEIRHDACHRRSQHDDSLHPKPAPTGLVPNGVDLSEKMGKKRAILKTGVD